MLPVFESYPYPEYYPVRRGGFSPITTNANRYVVFKDKTFEYVDAYGLKIVDGRYVFDLGHGATYQITAEVVNRIEEL